MKYILYAARAMALAGLTLQAPAFAADAAPQHHIRGTLSAVSPAVLQVATATGSVEVPLDAKTKVIGVVSANASEITAGTFIGTANIPASGAARAIEVVVFPKSMAGLGEGDYAWDLPVNGKHSMMTNGTVAKSGAHSMMTNATVSKVAGGDVKTVKLTYKGGTKSVSIPTDAPIVRLVPATKALLAVGAHVVVFPAAAKAPVPLVLVGEKGVVPPM